MKAKFKRYLAAKSRRYLVTLVSIGRILRFFFFQFFDILIGIDIHVQLFLSEMKYFNEDEFIVSG